MPDLGIWLMPDNVRDGIFEDLLMAALPRNHETYIGSVVDRAKVDDIASFRDVERSKAIIKTHIAWQDPTKKNIGEAISAHFDGLIPACDQLLTWLRRLFIDEITTA